MYDKPRKMGDFLILLYYKYTEIKDHEAFAKEHLKFCEALNLKGRVLIAHEGINGTVSGERENAEAYMNALRQDPRFEGIEFKIDPGTEHAFKRLSVKPRKEIVSLHLENDISPNELTGTYLEPKEFYQALQEKDVVIIDARNDYESDLGKFRNALVPPVKNFRDLPQWVEENMENWKGKKILTYCTGGIRCEKFSGYLKSKGLKDVSQLHGGIVQYGKDPEVQGKLFDGKCYVFDNRISVDVNHTDDNQIFSKCIHSGLLTTRYKNCANPSCRPQFFYHEDYAHVYSGCCSKECEEKLLALGVTRE